MVEEVACALLDATRRMSINGSRQEDRSLRTEDNSMPALSSSVGSSGFWGSWKSSTSEIPLEDKTGSLPKNEANNWLGAFQRDRTMSESDAGNKTKLGVMAWLANGQRGGVQTNKKLQNLSEGVGHNRIRRSSSRDVEEAMAGGFNKASIYMPPF